MPRWGHSHAKNAMYWRKWSVGEPVLSNRWVIYESDKWPLEKKMTWGAPQGSRVGTFVWNTVYDDFLRMNLLAGTNIIGFTDDAFVMCAAKDVGTLELRINDMVGWADREMDTPSNVGPCSLVGQKARWCRFSPDASDFMPWLIDVSLLRFPCGQCRVNTIRLWEVGCRKGGCLPDGEYWTLPWLSLAQV